MSAFKLSPKQNLEIALEREKERERERLKNGRGRSICSAEMQRLLLDQHKEHHFTSSEIVRDVIIGVSAGLTLPFALAASLSGANVPSSIILTVGIAEVAAGAISMGLGGSMRMMQMLQRTSNQEMHSTAPFLRSEASSSSLLPENRQFNLEVSSLNIPVDQMKTIQNINTLISELALEKEELMQGLLAESSKSSMLKYVNIGANRHTLANSEHLGDKLTTQVEVWVDVTSCEKQLLELLDVVNCYLEY
ncbi:unnamed protein product [Camellia sinensis]